MAQAGYEMVVEGLHLMAEAMNVAPEDPLETARHARQTALVAVNAAVRLRLERGDSWQQIADDFGGRLSADDMRERFAPDDDEEPAVSNLTDTYLHLLTMYEEIARAHIAVGVSPELQADPRRSVAS